MRRSFAVLMSFGILLVCVQSSTAQSRSGSAASDSLPAAGVLLTGDALGLEASSLNRSEDAPKPPKPKKGKRKGTS
jgi:hypothetical protein